jgi:hypothetical protein
MVLMQISYEEVNGTFYLSYNQNILLLVYTFKHCLHYNIVQSVHRLGYGLDVGEPRFDFRQGQAILSSPRNPDRVWGLLSLLSNGYRVPFTRK